MKKLGALLSLLAGCAYAGDVLMRVDNAKVGPVLSINLVKDGGLTGHRDAGSIAMFECAVANANSRGCIEPGAAQNFGTGAKTFGGFVTASGLSVTSSYIEGTDTTGPLYITSYESAAAMDPSGGGVTIGTLAVPDVGDAILLVEANGRPDPFAVTTYGPKQIIGNGLPGSGTGYTVNYQGQSTHRVHSVTLTFAALDAAATSDEMIWNFGAQTRVLRVIADVTQTFTGGGLTDMDVVCGPSFGTTYWLVSFDVDTAPGTYGDSYTEIGAGLTSATLTDVTWGGTDDVACRFTCTGANCNAATQGSITFYIETMVYPTP